MMWCRKLLDREAVLATKGTFNMMLKVHVKSSDKVLFMKWECGNKYYVKWTYFICDLKYVA